MPERIFAVFPLGYFQIPFIEYLKSLKYFVVGADENPNSPGVSIVDYSIKMPLEEPDFLIDIFQSKGWRPTGAISYCSDVAVPLVSKLADFYDIVGPSRKSINFLTNKEYQREFWNNCEIPNPKFIVITQEINYVNAVSGFEGDFVIKPTDSSGSRGVGISFREDPNLIRKIKTAFSYARSGRVIIEEYIEGDEYTFDGFFQNGRCFVLAITKKENTITNLPTVSNLLRTIDVNSKLSSEISDFVTKAFEHLDGFDGPVHCELKVFNGNCAGMIEVSGRGGGSNLADKMIMAHSGIDYRELSVKYALGEKILELQHRNRPVEMIFVPSKKGIFNSLEVPLPDRSVEMQVNTYVESGTLLRTPDSDGDRIADIILASDSVDDLRKASTSIREKIRVDYNCV